MKCLALLNKDREYFQYNSGDLIYLISPLTTQLRTSSRKVTTNYVGPLVVYKIVDLHNYLLMTIDGKLLRGLFEHERLKPAMIRMDKGNVSTLSALKSHELGDIHLNSPMSWKVQLQKDKIQGNTKITLLWHCDGEIKFCSHLFFPTSSFPSSQKYKFKIL